MTLHLIKLSVGIRDLEHLAEVQRERLRRSRRERGRRMLWHRTRHRPRQAEALLDGGSIYWVVGGRIRGRQRLLGFESDVDEEGRQQCLILLDPELVSTEAWPQRAFQGWRYLDPRNAPPDRVRSAIDDEMPAEMIAELRALGLI